ncbi:hypothetical protein OEZ85_000521 [Tetradesmus obliquus]|uniref:RAP domain-containing protein n=1 Tax=Tetradesmus obliquus TaxID=3088 RepID=A0ABY8UNT7_TETOB|nr:hypothetical protein OEZ85_000521 [Tetradesmus obliquus]
MGVDLPYATGLAPLLKAAKAALQTEALAAASAADEAAGSSSSSSSRTRSRPHQQQEQQQQQQQERLSASMIADLVRALQHMRDQLPAIYALPLTDVFLQQQPSPKDIAKYLCGFGAMSLAVNMPQLTIMLQQLLQPEALQQLSSAEVGKILWGVASMGYSLQPTFSSNNQDYCSLVLKPTTLFRNKSLRARGYTVVCVPFYQWASKQPVVQQWLVQRLIDAALASEPPPHKQQ